MRLYLFLMDNFRQLLLASRQCRPGDVVSADWTIHSLVEQRDSLLPQEGQRICYNKL